MQAMPPGYSGSAGDSTFHIRSKGISTLMCREWRTLRRCAVTPLDASATNFLPSTCNNPSTCDIPLTEHLPALAAATFAYQDLNDVAVGYAHVSARRRGVVLVCLLCHLCFRASSVSALAKLKQLPSSTVYHPPLYHIDPWSPSFSLPRCISRLVTTSHHGCRRMRSESEKRSDSWQLRRE